MNSRVATFVFLAAATTAAPILGCATDRKTTAAVQGRFAADPDVDRFEVDVDTRGGVVTLRGTVESMEVKQSAEELASRTEGVDLVDNQLVVQEEDMGEWADKFGSDFMIRTRVGSKLLADPDVRRFGIDVDVEDGVVYLSGDIEDEMSKREAEKLASTVPGVRAVRNELEVQRMSSSAKEGARSRPEESPEQVARE